MIIKAVVDEFRHMALMSWEIEHSELGTAFVFERFKPRHIWISWESMDMLDKNDLTLMVNLTYDPSRS